MIPGGPSISFCSVLLTVLLDGAGEMSIQTCTDIDNVGCPGAGFLAIARRRLRSITLYDPHVVVKLLTWPLLLDLSSTLVNVVKGRSFDISV